MSHEPLNSDEPNPAGELFNWMISKAVERRTNRRPKRGIKDDRFLKYVLNREALSGFLWDCYRELDIGDEMHWSDFRVKRLSTGLRIKVGKETKEIPILRPTAPRGIIER